ncbi:MULTISPECIES: putative T7SS-secreted protein [Streptomycetaceae]|uniref:Integral membrane protein n=1 Tax=Streptantibioticus cattleyicolor (strain ATCC 35852 / DSM 46488 / JCM 4925 / NBRC 14057 / NRRL 8057) TaxID=1003195 RepID=G8WWN8_STREN|nr:hypothetical protein [Streptantibioticus cattleyicolor]AEW94925.1 integral membrane protein [Streptantibioticus cattleyicolor NRRL 8057 = DSM 46488]
MAGERPNLRALVGHDPTPGNVEETRSLARQLDSLASDLSTAVGELALIDIGQWKGKSALAFRDHVSHDVQPLIVKAQQSFAGASNAMSKWASRLQGFQDEADALDRQVASHQNVLDAANKAARTPSPAPNPSPSGSDHPDKQKEAAVTAAKDALNSLKQRVLDLEHAYRQAAKAIADQLVSAGHISPAKPGLLHSILHGVESAWEATTHWVKEHAELIKMIGDVLGTISAVLGAIAIFTAPFEPIGAVFAGLALGVGLGALGAHALAKAGGADVSWSTLALDTLGVLPGVKGLTMGAKMAKGASAAERVAELGGTGFKAVTKESRIFKLFGKSVESDFIKGEGLGNRARTAVEGQLQFMRENQLVGTKLINPISRKLAGYEFKAMSTASRAVDGGIKIATHAITAPRELIKDWKTVEKSNPIAVQDFKVASKAFAWAASV